MSYYSRKNNYLEDASLEVFLEKCRIVIIKELCVDALISIKPEYVAKIVAGEKTFEFRKRIFKQNVNKVFIYSSAPEKKIVGYFKWRGALCGTPDEVWKKTFKNAGVNITRYNEYFKNRSIAYAIDLSSLYLFDEGISLEMYDGFRPPQSYCYFKNKDQIVYEKLCGMV